MNDRVVSLIVKKPVKPRESYFQEIQLTCQNSLSNMNDRAISLTVTKPVKAI